jgi:hypothetical protein
LKHKTKSLKHLSAKQLLARRGQLARRFDGVAMLLMGSLVTQGRRCGKQGCRCNAGELHGPYTYIATKNAEGKRRLVYFPAELLRQVEKRFASTERLNSALREISDINLELLSRRALD